MTEMWITFVDRGVSLREIGWDGMDWIRLIWLMIRISGGLL
jgi:hypothetical protein